MELRPFQIGEEPVGVVSLISDLDLLRVSGWYTAPEVHDPGGFEVVKEGIQVFRKRSGHDVTKYGACVVANPPCAVLASLLAVAWFLMFVTFDGSGTARFRQRAAATTSPALGRVRM